MRAAEMRAAWCGRELTKRSRQFLDGAVLLFSHEIRFELSEGKQKHYFNVCFEFDAGGELDLNRIALGCQSLT